MTETKSIPKEVKDFINEYFNLEIKGVKVRCPYYINTSGFLKLPVMAGKGSPKEIESKTNELLANHDFTKSSEEVICAEMEKLGLGVDCSGLVYQIYNKWLRDISNLGELKNYLPSEKIFKVRKYFSRRLKPEASVSADMFTSEPIAKKIGLEEVQPGDVIRTKGGKHILFITDVEYKGNIPTKIIFVQSANFYKRHGVGYGSIKIKDMDLGKSDWQDHDTTEEINWAYKGYRELMSNNGLWRPKLPVLDS